MPDSTLSDFSLDDIADYLDEKGYQVFAPNCETSVLANYIDDDTLLGEANARGLTPHMDDNEMAEVLENHGWKVTGRDFFKDFLWELYYDAVLLTPEQFMKGLNQIFIDELNKWI